MSEFSELLERIGRTPDEILVISYKEPDGPWCNIWTTVAEADEVVAPFWGKASVWYSVQPVKHRKTGRASAETVAGVVTLYADLDFKEGGLDMSQCAALIREASNILGTLPTAIVRSGGGIQPYWALERVDPAMGEMILATWRQFIIGTAAKLGGKADSGVYNLDRVLRVPGPPNLKTEYGPGGAPTGASFPGGAPVEFNDALGRIHRAVEALPVEIQAATAPVVRELGLARETVEAGTGTPVDDFNSRVEWDEILPDLGWQLHSTTGLSVNWTRPGKSTRDGFSATTGYRGGTGTEDRLHIFTDAPEAHPFEQGKLYSKAEAVRLIRGESWQTFTARIAKAGYGAPRAAARDWTIVSPEVKAAEGAKLAAAQEAADAARLALQNPFATEEQVQNAELVLAAAVEALKGKRFYWHDELDEIDPPEPLITGIIDVACIALLSGMNQTYKTFVAIAWACSLATGKAWGPHGVPSARRVLYVAAEGASGINLRIKAWEKANGPVPRGMLAVFPRPVKVMDAEALWEIEDFIHENEVGLVVLDTMRKMTPGIEENSSTEMGEAMAMVEGIRERQGCSALWVHHTGYIGTRTRGSSSIEDDSDISWVIELENGTEKDVGNRRILKQTKLKDGELAPGRPLLFKLEDVETKRGPARSASVELAPGEYTAKPKLGGKEPIDTDLVDGRIIDAVGDGANTGNAVYERVRGTKSVCLDRIQFLTEKGILDRDSKNKLVLTNFERRQAWGGQELWERLQNPSATN